MAKKTFLWALLMFVFVSQGVSFAEEKGVDVQNSIEVHIRKSYEKFSINGISRTGESGYILHNVFQNKRHYGRIVSNGGEILGYFSAMEMVVVICRDGFGAEDGCRELPEGDIILRVPLIPEGEKAEIFTPEGKKILTINLSSVGK